jgi:hypothetical protein
LQNRADHRPIASDSQTPFCKSPSQIRNRGRAQGSSPIDDVATNPKIRDCRGLSQRSFGFLDNRSKRRFFVHCQIGQNLTVDLDGRLFQTGDQTAVGQTVDTSTSIDTGDPQSAELTLPLTAVTVGILASLDYRLLGNAEYARTRSVVALASFRIFL